MKPFTAQAARSGTHDVENVIALNAMASCQDAPQRVSTLSAIESRRLGLLRDLLAKSRLEGDNDLERAYARLAANGVADATSFGVTLFHTLPYASDRQIEFFCRVCPNASQDEWWLLRLIEAFQNGDVVNTEALLGFRIRRPWRRRIRYLAACLATRIDAASTPKSLASDGIALNVPNSSTVRTIGQAKS